MKNTNKKVSVSLFLCLLIIMLSSVVLLNPQSKNVAYAAEIFENTTLNTSEIKINGWREFRDMETYGYNNDAGCGMTEVVQKLTG